MTILLFWLLCGLSVIALVSSLNQEKMEKYDIAVCILLGPFLILIAIAFLNNPIGLKNYFRNLQKELDKKIKELEKEMEDLKKRKK
jgi:hypothetical protein